MDAPTPMAPGERIPREVSVFLREHLHSTTQLELLLLLHGRPGQPFTAADASRALRVPERFVTGQLLDFARSDVLAMDDQDPPTWRFETGGPHAHVVGALAECVRKRKRAVHDLILSAPSSDVQLFSDAFRLRRDD
jgi:hypothetical protein